MFELKLGWFVVFDVLYHFYFIVHDTKLLIIKRIILILIILIYANLLYLGEMVLKLKNN